MESVSSRIFQKAIRVGKQKNKHGWMVDKHTRKEYRSMRCYLSTDRSMGIAITRDGDVVSAFSTGKNPKAINKLLPFAVAAGGRKLDCYGGGLQDMYAKFGAKAHGQVPWDDEYAPSGWVNGKHNRHPVVAMSLPRTLSGVVRAYKNPKKINLARVPVFNDYDEMIKRRDASISGVTKGLKGAFGSGG